MPNKSTYSVASKYFKTLMLVRNELAKLDDGFTGTHTFRVICREIAAMGKILAGETTFTVGDKVYYRNRFSTKEVGTVTDIVTCPDTYTMLVEVRWDNPTCTHRFTLDQIEHVGVPYVQGAEKNKAQKLIEDIQATRIVLRGFMSEEQHEYLAKKETEAKAALAVCALADIARTDND